MKEKIKNPENVFEICYIKAMETYWVNCKKNTPNKNSSVRKTK